MKTFFIIILFYLLSSSVKSQTFIRSELTTSLTTPWEIIYGPDNFLWITESGGKVSRVNPANGSKTVVYTAPDYFGGSALEQSTLCFQPNIGVGTLGMALHPDFLNPASAFIYYLYSYNSGTIPAPVTKFKIVRLTWDAISSSVIANTDLIMQMPTGYDHLGGRLMAVKQNSVSYIYLTCGDNGISETNSPACYSPQSNNPNNFAQDPNYKNGKIHRFNIDGTIPFDNPIPGNCFFTRGHRNPQGLMYNPTQNILYEIEHGDQTDDEINILKAGMNYGWKNVRGYHADNNCTGEATYITSYTAYPSILNDSLKEALHSWCAVPQPTSVNNLDWCTVAPSDGIYYDSNGIPGWNNSLLVVTLKNGTVAQQEVYQFKLNPNGTSLVPSTSLTPNPSKFFGSDKLLNGRLRDIALSPDGKIIYLINNGGANADKITVYTYLPAVGINEEENTSPLINIFPIPSIDFVTIKSNLAINSFQIFNMLGEQVKHQQGNFQQINVSNLSSGIYFLNISFNNGKNIVKKILKQ